MSLDLTKLKLGDLVIHKTDKYGIGAYPMSVIKIWGRAVTVRYWKYSEQEYVSQDLFSFELEIWDEKKHMKKKVRK